ncbi:MAG: DUF2905 domain-containing protein [Thermodesulfobacteriota bacterium]|nr:DUF2905 domain-containing protein [Thermodesulfobacteriota bacterium]
MFDLFSQLGKSLIIIGIIFILAGIFFSFGTKIPGPGRLPGDIYIKKNNFTFYFPFATCILISILLSIILYLFRK